MQVLVDQGESEDRIEHLDSWRASGLYSEREKTALTVAEALGSTPPMPVPKATVQQAKVHFNDAEILQLTWNIFAVNDWNHRCTRTARG
jgi:alkylhydroperoxidase family enzyme